MSILYIRLPSKATADTVAAGSPLYCQFALASDRGAIEREGMAALTEMAETVRRAQRVVLILAASDVTLLRVKVPPMTPARLKAALPNLVEDQLMTDPADNVVVAGAVHDDLRTVAVVARGWLELLTRTMVTHGARRIRAIPAQFCLRTEPETVVAAVVEYGADVDIALRLSQQDGLGLPVSAEQAELVPAEVLQSLAVVAPQQPIHLYVAPHRVVNYQDALRLEPELEQRVAVSADSWQRWIEGADDNLLDLMAGLGVASGPRFNWRPWRWPLALAASLLLVNAVALNIDWLGKKRQADAMRSGMIQTYRAAFPKDPVVIDPQSQLRQKIAAARRETGALAPDDFIALTAAFAEAWAGAGQSPQAIAGLEYRDRALSVKLKPGNEAVLEQLRGPLSSRNLSVNQAAANVLQVRSAK